MWSPLHIQKTSGLLRVVRTDIGHPYESHGRHMPSRSVAKKLATGRHRRRAPEKHPTEFKVCSRNTTGDCRERGAVRMRTTLKSNQLKLIAYMIKVQGSTEGKDRMSKTQSSTKPLGTSKGGGSTSERTPSPTTPPGGPAAGATRRVMVCIAAGKGGTRLAGASDHPARA